MPDIKMRVRFSWTAQGHDNAHIDRAGHRRQKAIHKAETYRPLGVLTPIHVLRADFVMDGTDHIEWIVEVNAADFPTARDIVRAFFTDELVGFNNVTAPRSIVEVT